VDNTIKLQLLKREQEEIREELAMDKKVATEGAQVVTSTDKIPEKEKLVDKAAVLESDITPVEIKEINEIIENIPVNEKKQVKAEIEELKKDVDEYKEDIKEVNELTMASKLKETTSAKILSKRVEKLISDMNNLMAKIEKEQVMSQNGHQKNMVSIEELVATIKRIKGFSSDAQENKVRDILKTLDQDQDGRLDNINDVLKVSPIALILI
jgi:hypothetical protein